MGQILSLPPTKDHDRVSDNILLGLKRSEFKIGSVVSMEHVLLSHHHEVKKSWVKTIIIRGCLYNACMYTRTHTHSQTCTQFPEWWMSDFYFLILFYWSPLWIFISPSVAWGIFMNVMKPLWFSAWKQINGVVNLTIRQRTSFRVNFGYSFFAKSCTFCCAAH